MTKEQTLDAIEQMKVHCKMTMEGDYDYLSARGTLYTLGFHGEECEHVLKTLFDGGFKNCLDPSYSEIRISEDVCYWGADQLLSRLQSIWIREA